MEHQDFRENHGFNPSIVYPQSFPPFGNLENPFLVPSSLGSLINRRLFYDGSEMGKLAAQEMVDAKALAASRSHSEAERRRRERINNHLARLRSLLPCATKTDKASLLAEVIQHVKELQQQTAVLAEANPIPTEVDDVQVDVAEKIGGKSVVRATLCCDDRSTLMSELARALKAMRLVVVKAEISTLGGRLRSVLFVTGEGNDSDEKQSCQRVSAIHEALKALLDRGDGHGDSLGATKRQKINSNRPV